MNSLEHDPYQSRIRWDKLPTAAGICSLDDASRDGLSVEACVERLKRFHFGFSRLWETLLTRLTSEPVYELKMSFSHHAYLCSENVTSLRERVAEMRHPPLGLDKIPHPSLDVFFDEIHAAPKTHQLLFGIFRVTLPAMEEAATKYLTESHPLADAPGIRVMRAVRLDLADMRDCGAALLDAYQYHLQNDASLEEWESSLKSLMAGCGGFDGTGEVVEGDHQVNRYFSGEAKPYDGTPQRDFRFPDPYNMGVHAEEFLYNPEFSSHSKTLMMYYKRLREIDVPEMMASILVELKDRPWDFYRDMTRQLWDEARHAIMGEAGFHKLGINWGELVKINFTWSKGLNEQLTPVERHAVLWFIEQGLMNKTGKRYEWEVGMESGDPLSALFQDFDWADEVLHARIGRDWYVKDFDSVDAAATYGSECWNKVMSDWDQWAKDGLTNHQNWWPALYLEFCRNTSQSPNPRELAFNHSYRDSRADLQRISASG